VITKTGWVEIWADSVESAETKVQSIHNGVDSIPQINDMEFDFELCPDDIEEFEEAEE